MRFDLLVIGAGPAGCAAAIRAAQGRLKVAIVERTPFPRDLPGEAMHPEAETMFRKLGVAKQVTEAGFIRTPGWILHSHEREVILFAGRGKLRFGYLASRAQLDALLLDYARTMGVKVLQPARVTGVRLKEKRAQTDQGEIRFRHLVDATGANGLLQRELKLPVRRVSQPLIARYGYVFGDPAPGIMPEFHEHPCGWTWLARVSSDCHQFVRLPLQESVVLPALPPPYDSVLRPRGADVTWRFVPACAGAGYFLCGDAAAVLDPAASSGVERALAGGSKAAELIVQIRSGRMDAGTAAASYRRWSFRRFARDARKISSRYAELENPPAWLETLERDFVLLEESVNANPLAIQSREGYSELTMATKTTAKKTTTKKAAATTSGKNLTALTKAKIIPAHYKLLTPAEKKALETLSKTEVAAIVSTKAKLGGKYFKKHAAHGMYF